MAARLSSAFKIQPWCATDMARTLERERESLSAQRMRDGVRRDQIDIALDPDDVGL